MKWQCRWRDCPRWAQSNGLVLCSTHYRENAFLLEHNHSAVVALTNLRNNSIAAPAENDPPVGPPFFPVVTRRRRRQPRPLLVVAREEVGQGGVPVEGPPFSPRDRIQPNLPRPLPVAREEVGGVQELVSGDRVGNILAENANINAQLLNVADTAAVGENIDYQANNDNDTHGEVDDPFGDVPPDDIDDHHMANVDPQEPGMQVPPDTIPLVDGHQHLLLPRRLPTRPALTRTQQRDDYARLREIESERHAEQCAQQRANDYVRLQEVESERRDEQLAQQRADDRNITDQLLNVDNHQDVVADDPQELVHDSGAAREQLGVHESESEQQFAAREEEGVGEEINAEQRAHDPVGDVILDIGANENIGNVENNEENQDDVRDVVDFPGIEEGHEYGWTLDIAQINDRLELIIQQLQLKDDKIKELEGRIKELEHWKNTHLSTSWPSCTSVNFSAADSVSQDILAGGESEDNTSFNGGDDNPRQDPVVGRARESRQRAVARGKNIDACRKRRRGRNRRLLESTVQQPPTKRRKAIAPNNDQGQSPYYRDDFVDNPRRTNARDPAELEDAHAGLTNCDLICYSNVIFQGLASCLHVSEFLRSPPKEEHRLRFPLYHAFASVMSSMVSGQESVVNPATFINLFRDSHENYELRRGMYFNSQWMNKLTINDPLTDSSSR